jgi:hypothetical protein
MYFTRMESESEKKDSLCSGTTCFRATRKEAVVGTRPFACVIHLCGVRFTK